MSPSLDHSKSTITGSAWNGLAASGLAAFLGGLSLQVHGLAAPDLGGGFGVSADEASWITTGASMAEGAAVLTAGPLIAVAGPRRVLSSSLIVIGCTGIAIYAVADADGALILRVIQAFACGLLPVVMMGWAMRVFLPSGRALPLMLFALASSAPVAVAALLAGVVGSHWGGRGPYLFDAMWSPPVLLAVLILMPREPLSLAPLRGLDWIGGALLAGTIMLALILLTQGERRFWTTADWFGPLVAAIVILAACAVVRLATADKPFFDLALLMRPIFTIGLAEALSLRFALLIASFAVPQALARLQGFRPEQTGEAILWLGFGQVVGFPLAWLWGRLGDARLSLAAGLGLFAVAAVEASEIDPAWGTEQFQAILVVAGLGQGLYLTSVLAFATSGIAPAEGQTASGLFNLTRVLGTAGATAAVGYALRLRENGHSARLVESITDAGGTAGEWLIDLTRTYLALTPDAAFARNAALGALSRNIQAQAYALAFSDVFVGIAVIVACFALAVPLLPRLSPPAEPTR